MTVCTNCGLPIIHTRNLWRHEEGQQLLRCALAGPTRFATPAATVPAEEPNE